MKVLATLGACLILCSATHATYGQESFRDRNGLSPPKTSLPDSFIHSVKFLLRYGLGDPRGGEYRRAQICVRSAWTGKAELREIHGWVFPDGQVLAWNGLRYKAESVGPPADLGKDIEAQKFGVPFGSISTPPTTPHVAAALLLILGDVGSAERLLQKQLGSDSGSTFLSLANGYLGPRFLRAAHAQMAGDHKAVYSDALVLQEIAPLFEAEAWRLFGPMDASSRFESTMQNPGERRAFMFLSQVPELYADAKRRLEHPEDPPDLEAILRLPKQQRVERLVENLDKVAARQWGQPGGVSLVADPISGALSREGEEVIDRLFLVIEEDDRLTQSMSFGRDFGPYRTIFSVRDVAFSITSQILQLSLRDANYESFSIERLRQFWRENRHRSRAERLHAQLADDAGDYHLWTEAASQLLRPIDVTQVGGWISVPMKGPGQTPRVGDELKGKIEPSVSKLLDKRSRQLMDRAELSHRPLAQVGNSLEIGMCLASWDTEAAKEVLPDLLARILVLLQDEELGDPSERLFEQLGVAVSRLVAAGDHAAWATYRQILEHYESIRPTPNVLRPLWSARSSPEAVQISKWIFEDPDSNFFRILMEEGKPSTHLIANILSRWLEIPAFRELLLRLLRDKTVIGDVRRDETGVRVAIAESSRWFSLNPKVDQFAKAGDTNTFRICDDIAVAISRLKGAPAYNPVWPDTIRDPVLEKMASFLQTLPETVTDILPQPVYDRYDW